MSSFVPRSDYFALANCLFSQIRKEKIETILDVGASDQSVALLQNEFKAASLVAYAQEEQIPQIKELDTTNMAFTADWANADSVDLVYSQIYFGDHAQKNGGKAMENIAQYLALPSKYTIFIDYLEEPRINWKQVRELIEKEGEILLDIDLPCNTVEQHADFVAHNHRGILIKKRA